MASLHSKQFGLQGQQQFDPLHHDSQVIDGAQDAFDDEDAEYVEYYDYDMEDDDLKEQAGIIMDDDGEDADIVENIDQYLDEEDKKQMQMIIQQHKEIIQKNKEQAENEKMGRQAKLQKAVEVLSKPQEELHI